AAHTEPGAGHRGDPAAVVGGLSLLERGGEVLHRDADVVAEVAVPGAPVEVAEGVGGPGQGVAERGDEGAADALGQGAAGHLGLLTRSGPGCGRERPTAGAARRPAASA